MDLSSHTSTAQLVVLATSSALTALFYSIYKNRVTTANRLKGAKKVSIDQDLKELLSEAPGKCVPYAVIEGAVKAVNETLSSQFVDNCKGVIERLTLKEKKMVWNRTTHLWNHTEKVIHQRTNSVPFAIGSLDESISTCVRVVRPLEASALELETTYQNFHPAVQSFTSTIGHFISGERPKGIHEIEEMLRVGDSVTGVGELVLDNSLIKLQPPKEGYCYFLSRSDYDSLLRKQESSVRMWKIITIIFGVAACSTLVYILWKKVAHYRQKKRKRGLMEEFEEQQRQRIQDLNLDESTISPSSCTVCLNRERDCVFLECGHVCACLQCYEFLPRPKKCPICRSAIDRVVPLYNS
ncbi:mitochondrial ubiquitin ligase activator of NFKB 1 [Periophthalmus magnuspinnatus]|uniref:RING-type E3 ubiquitin transferase n=1 Tax=Periophthalmus magnuspinnatus TaxID=409849 RepID=A0A3B3ZTB1_9GOBI|nr:mitochondrial ubiquitin ligase activator of NFKB 1 [Periophthalmus magnuspinnatus]